ncbi:Holliday junction branch migration protein RuvA [Candidatus Amesbacteria bacterium]|nr:Holliday junction branch migration protein RuvA [Candidatus Amesbacteria bacterium]
MIGYIQGEIKYTNIDSILVLVNNIGYKVYVAKLFPVGSQIELYIHTHVREDSLDLYGFANPSELQMFEWLISVSGIGPKTALLTMAQGAAKIGKAIATADVGFFTQIPRLGKKNAQKIIIELKNKIGGLTDLNLSQDEPTTEAILALQSMGYTQSEAQRAINIVGQDESVAETVRKVLKYYGR